MEVPLPERQAEAARQVPRRLDAPWLGRAWREEPARAEWRAVASPPVPLAAES